MTRLLWCDQSDRVVCFAARPSLPKLSMMTVNDTPHYKCLHALIGVLVTVPADLECHAVSLWLGPAVSAVSSMPACYKMHKKSGAALKISHAVAVLRNLLTSSWGEQQFTGQRYSWQIACLQPP